MSMRGVRKPGAITVTSAVRGLFRDQRHPRRGDGADPGTLTAGPPPPRRPRRRPLSCRLFRASRARPGRVTRVISVRDPDASQARRRSVFHNWGPAISPGMVVAPRLGHMTRVPGLGDEAGCLVMGVVNVTPDSFSDGGRWFDAGRGRRARARPGRRGRRPRRRRRRVDPAGRRSGSAGARSSPGAPRDRGARPRRACRSASTRCGPRSPRRPSPPGRGWSTT